MTKNLILFRGLPGSGKSSLAAALCQRVVSADTFFETLAENGDLIYNFDATKLKDAHEWCQQTVDKTMHYGVETIGVANTFTQEWEMKPYFEMAEKYGYRISTIIVENRHGSKNIHSVPSEIIEKMKDRFELKLY